MATLYEKLKAKAQAQVRAAQAKREHDQERKYKWEQHAFGISRRGLTGGRIVIYDP